MSAAKPPLGLSLVAGVRPMLKDEAEAKVHGLWGPPSPFEFIPLSRMLLFKTLWVYLVLECPWELKGKPKGSPSFVG